VNLIRIGSGPWVGDVWNIRHAGIPFGSWCAFDGDTAPAAMQDARRVAFVLCGSAERLRRCTAHTWEGFVEAFYARNMVTGRDKSALLEHLAKIHAGVMSAPNVWTVLDLVIAPHRTARTLRP